MHVETGGCGFAHNTTQRLGCEQGNESLGKEDLCSCPLSMILAMKILMNDVAGTSESRGIFSLRDNASCVYFFFLFLSKREAVSTVNKNSATPKKAMTDKHARWSKKEWYSKSKPHWRSSASEDAGQKLT